VRQTQAVARTRSWLTQFPAPLLQLTALRLVASIGAGGVLYLTPMVFHHEAFRASTVTGGLALAAAVGTVGRLVCGLLLDRGRNCSLPVLLAVLLAAAGDSVLLGAEGVPAYLAGQVLLGLAMGLYWPAIELAVPLAAPPVPSARAFALVRTADALGIASGALIGAVLASLGRLRGIYVVDLACLTTMAALVGRSPLPAPRPRTQQRPPMPWQQWFPPLVPLLAIAMVATALPALMQSALPLDLVRGSLEREPLPEGLGALLIGVQLGLLLLLQWPVGRSLARHPVGTGLRLSLVCGAVGCLLLALSALVPRGEMVVLALAQLPLALGEAAFLPIATEAVIELTPYTHQGLAMALFSQCFAISAFGAPLIAGLALDTQRHGAGLWLGTALVCLAALPLARRLSPTVAA